MTRNDHRVIPLWETTAVEALPTDWRNVYDIDGKPELSPCPAILVQEHRSTLRGPAGSNLLKEEQPRPYEVRVVFADLDGAVLQPADDAANYVRTLGPGQEIER